MKLARCSAKAVADSTAKLRLRQSERTRAECSTDPPSNARVEILPEREPRGTVRASMRSSLSLQRSLFKHQARQIARQVQGASPHFRAYQRRYEAATRGYRKIIPL